MTVGFLVSVVLAAVAVVVATPEFAEPAAGEDGSVVAAAPSVSPTPAIGVEERPSSKPPEALKGYAWPLKGGRIVKYYEWDGDGFLTVGGRRINQGLTMSWFDGAWVKAPHKGRVIAAGRDWATEVGFEDPMEEVVAELNKHKKRSRRQPIGVVIDDRNGYHSVIVGLKELNVEVGEKIKAGKAIGRMAGNCCIRYELVRMDGGWQRVAQEYIERDGYPYYTRERVDPLLVLPLEAKRKPPVKPPPGDPPKVEPL